ncbi:MAG: 5-oxoprolinase [Deltaproteobacteria bacterium]|nr:5-oxoprolinase [Deltaproteobacteria bacterium]
MGPPAGNHERLVHYTPFTRKRTAVLALRLPTGPPCDKRSRVRSRDRHRTIVGIDTGGTFTDVIAFTGGTVRTLKILSTPSDPAVAVLEGLRELLRDEPVDTLTYSSTVATNALLQRQGARVMLLTTAGFEDIIEIGRQNRPELYALEPQPVIPLVPRACRIGVRERTLADGRVLTPLRRSTLLHVLRKVRRRHPESVAVCFLHSYVNPSHELLVGTALNDWPDVFSSLSHALSAEHREYERLSTTVINAYVGPVMGRHLRHLQRGLGRVRPRVMQSNGGAISAPLAAREAVRTVLSGPAAGVVGAWTVGRALGLRRIITFDMGGTSTDVSLLDGSIRYRSESTIDGLPLRVPAIDIHTVGAGGGSIARMDTGGALIVGPESAGADPGPACYGRGQLPTVTDANVVLGRLIPENPLGGRVRLQPTRSVRAIERLARRLRLGTEQAAEGIVQVVNASMERAIRTISVERGYEPRNYALIAFGGAAGQHACELSAALGIRRVIVPRHPGLLSARGAASADIQRDYVQTVRLTDPPAARLRTVFAAVKRTARAELRAEGVRLRDTQFTPSVDVRYQGQSYEISVPFSPAFANSFHTAHERLYGYADRGRAIEVISVRLLARAPGPRPAFDAFRVAAGHPPIRGRLRWNGRWLDCAVYDRTHVPAGAVCAGPAVIAEFSATTVVPPGWRCRVHAAGHLEVTRAG